MVTLLDELDKYKQDDLQTALNNVYPSEKRQRKIKEHYEEYGFSPLTTRNKNIPFIQSLDSLLEFEKPTELEYDLFRIVDEQYSEVFFHEPVRWITYSKRDLQAVENKQTDSSKTDKKRWDKRIQDR